MKKPAPAAAATTSGPTITEPDLVDRIFDYLFAEVPRFRESLATPEEIYEAKQAMRVELGGTTGYIRTNMAREERTRQILANFNGRNAAEVARRLGIGKATVYRTIKQPGKVKTS